MAALTREFGIYAKDTNELLEGTWSTYQEADYELNQAHSPFTAYVAKWTPSGPVKVDAKKARLIDG